MVTPSQYSNLNTHQNYGQHIVLRLNDKYIYNATLHLQQDEYISALQRELLYVEHGNPLFLYQI